MITHSCTYTYTLVAFSGGTGWIAPRWTEFLFIFLSAPAHGFLRIYSSCSEDCPNPPLWLTGVCPELFSRKGPFFLDPKPELKRVLQDLNSPASSRHHRSLVQRGTLGGRWSYNYRLENSNISSCHFCLFPAITVISGQTGINRPLQVEKHLTLDWLHAGTS